MKTPRFQPRHALLAAAFALLAAAPAASAADPAVGALTLEPTTAATLVTPGWLARVEALNRQRERAARRAALLDRLLPTDAGDIADADFLADAPAVRRADVATADDAPAAFLPADDARPSFAPAASGFTPTLPATVGYSPARFAADLPAAPARTRLATEGTAASLGGSPSAASLPVPVDAAASAPATMSGWAVTRSFGAAALVGSRPAASVSTAAAGPQPAAIKPSGAAYGWGNDNVGEVGDGTNGSGGSNPRTSPTAALVLTSGVTSVTAGDTHSLALTSGGQVYVYGNNQYGELGPGNNSGTPTPNSTPVLMTGLSGVTALAAGQSFSLAVTGAGQVYGFGINSYGQLGNATNNGSTNIAANPTPTLVAGLSGVTALAAGQNFSLALTSGGQVYGFGINRYGQLGNATNAGTSMPNPTPTLVPNSTGLTGVIAIAAGQSHSLALTSGGQVYGFGENQYGQLGNTTNTVGTFNTNASPLQVVGFSGVTGIAAGQFHSLAVTAGGNVLSLGYNNMGQLGNGTTDTNVNYIPYEVQYHGANLANIVQVAAGYESSYALDNAGDLYVWGYNNQGQLGLGNTTNQTTPQLILPPTGQYYQFIEADASGTLVLAIVGAYPVPEPGTWVGGALLLGAAGWTLRRRRATRA